MTLDEAINEKEVDFHTYCPLCKFNKTEEYEEPCNECLENPSNLGSHKPVNFKGGN